MYDTTIYDIAALILNYVLAVCIAMAKLIATLIACYVSALAIAKYVATVRSLQTDKVRMERVRQDWRRTRRRQRFKEAMIKFKGHRTNTQKNLKTAMQVAVLSALHPRLGQQSLLQTLDDDILGYIMQELVA